MPVILLFVFIAVPILEIAVFIQAGDQLGLWPTLAIVILTAFLGTALLHYQGLRTLGRVQESLQRGDVPVASRADGFGDVLPASPLGVPMVSREDGSGAVLPAAQLGVPLALLA